MKNEQDILAFELWQKYSVSSPNEDAEKYRNPYINILVNYAKHTGAELQKILDALDTTIVIGGSLGYKATVRDRYDIDLRILFPASDNIESRMEKASNLLYEKAGFSEVRIIVEKFHDEDNIVYHLEKKVTIEGLPLNVEASLEINIQSQEKYFGMAALASQLPDIVVDRLIVAKELSKLVGKDEYKQVKKHWQNFLKWIDANGYREAKPDQKLEVLAQAKSSYPLFLKEKE